MELLDRLGDEDRDLIDSWIREYANNYNHYWGDGPDLDHILRFWNSDKQDLFEMFGNELILTKEVNFQIGDKELKDAMEAMLNDDDFYDAFNDKISPIYRMDGGFDIWLRLTHLLRPDVLVRNEYDIGTCIVPGEYTVDGKPVKIQQGCRPIRTLSKLCHAFGLDEKEFEQFRLKHSQILNTETLSGELCISIHPLDFMTMSDNNCGWDSCMSWVNARYGDGGEYRIGTVEMMNSPYVLVAYLKSHEDMILSENPEEMLWNSKRWRQLVIVNKDIVLGNRQYPYEDSSLEGTVLGWVRELAMKHFGSQYEETLSDIRNGQVLDNTYYSFSTGFMYNDIYDIRHAYRAEHLRGRSRYSLNFSGVANCMACGEVIDHDEKPETSSVCCARCGDYVVCADCGLWLEDDYVYSHDDECYCEDCYRDHVDYCELCHCDVDVNTLKTYAVSCEGNIILDWELTMCDDCYEEYKDEKIPNCVDIDNLTAYQCYDICGTHDQYAYALRQSNVGGEERADILRTIFN